MLKEKADVGTRITSLRMDAEETEISRNRKQDSWKEIGKGGAE